MPRMNDLHTADTLDAIVERYDTALKAMRAEISRIRKNAIKDLIGLANCRKLEVGLIGIDRVTRELSLKIDDSLNPNVPAAAKYIKRHRRR